MARLRRDSCEGVKTSPPGHPEPSAAKRPAGRGRARQSPRKRSIPPLSPSQLLEGSKDCSLKIPGADERDRTQPSSPCSTRKKHILLAPLSRSALLSPLRLEYPPKISNRSATTLDAPAITLRNASTRTFSRGTKLSVADNFGSDEDVEESVWCGSDSESGSSEYELPSPRNLMNSLFDARQKKQKATNLPKAPRPRPLETQSTSDAGSGNDPAQRNVNGATAGKTDLRSSSSSSKESLSNALLRFSPPHLIKRSFTPERPSTPPPAQSPPKFRLMSPSKTRQRVPTPPLRSSLDAFWNAESVNDWNDQYSPEKPLRSPKKNRLLQFDSSASPTSSPRRMQSPGKKTRAEIDAKRGFDTQKIQIANDFLEQLDTSITGGQIAGLSASTGGVRLVWSKTLNSTAGRANWRRESIKTRDPDGSVTTTHKHHASIELAEKVIDDQDRLLNVLAHEFCHLCNFMISGIKDRPHGAQFKAWGRKCTTAFAHRGVQVSTKHDYQIDYKYVWQCANDDCLAEFKRHSKSVDPKRHRCGTCKGQLIQIKPVPRKDAAVGGYAAFVKRHFADVKKGLPGASQKEVMEALGRKYRAEKEMGALDEDRRSGNTGVLGIEDISRALDMVTIED